MRRAGRREGEEGGGRKEMVGAGYDPGVPLQPSNRQNQESAKKVNSGGPETHGIKVVCF